MELSESEKRIQEEAVKYIKENREKLIENFILKKRPLKNTGLSLFMAGSPCAGKTEFSLRYMPNGIDKNDKKTASFLKSKGLDPRGHDSLFVRIDVDEIRGFLPQYRKTEIELGIKGNSHIVQKAANKGLDYLRDYCFENDISFLHDGTFANFKTMRRLIKKSLEKNRDVRIFYIYLNPLTAWDLTKKREAMEGRNIIKSNFINQFFHSQKNVDQIKKEFDNDVNLNFILKNKDNKDYFFKMNVDSVAKFIKKGYDNKKLQEFTQEELDSLIK